MRSTSSAAIAALLALAAPSFAAPPSSGDDSAPPKSPPFQWTNERGDRVECATTPWQLIDLGTIGMLHIYAGDHCSVPLSDALSEEYKKVFGDSCDLHDICYLAPGNSKGYCDDALKQRMDRDCNRVYSDTFLNGRCHVTAASWRAGLETPLSTQYYQRSQDWGKRNCRVIPKTDRRPGEASRPSS